VDLATGRLTALVLNGRNLVPPAHEVAYWRVDLVERETDRLVSLSSRPNGAADFAVVAAPRSAAGAQGQRWTVKRDTDGETVLVFDTWVELQQDRAAFRCAVERLAEEYVLDRVWGPQVPLAPLGASSAEDFLLLPQAHGQVVDNVHAAERRAFGRGRDRLTCIARTRYPSKMGALQMVFYGAPGGGLLLMTPDPSRRIKELVVDRADGVLRVAFVHYLAGAAPLGERVECPYPVRVQWISGDWYDAAQAYRAWAVSQSWCRESLATRRSTPDWFRNTPVWARIPRDPGVSWEEKSRWPLLLREAVGTPVAVHVYGWDEQGGPRNTLWPLHRPPARRFLDALEGFHRNEVRAVPYVNARIACLVSPAWDSCEPSMVRDREGRLAGTESWKDYCTPEELEAAQKAGRKVLKSKKHCFVYNDFAVGCMAAPRWRRTMTERSVPLVAQHGADGVYEDQAGAWALRCFAPGHGHQPGDPDAWLRGVNAVYGGIKAEWRKRGVRGVLVSEYLGEHLIPLVDGGLTVSPGLLMSHRCVPLFAAVYHTHMAGIGWADNLAELNRAPRNYCYFLIQPFVYGAQPGWISYAVPRLLKDQPAIVACLRAAAQLRRRFGDMLGCGKMLRPPRIEGVAWVDAPTPKPKKGIRAFPRPTILSGFFRSGADGDRALAVFCNWTEEVRGGTAHLDLSELARPAQIRFVDGAAVGAFSGAAAAFPIECEPYSVRAVAVER